ncbi:MAG: hypothetical protein R2853_10035 [Thermomicrobiales bacterium]
MGNDSPLVGEADTVVPVLSIATEERFIQIIAIMLECLKILMLQAYASGGSQNQQKFE